EKVPGFSPIHVHWAGQGMGPIEIYRQVACCGSRFDLTVHCIERFQFHKRSRWDVQRRRNVRMPSVVAFAWLAGERQVAIQMDVCRAPLGCICHVKLLQASLRNELLLIPFGALRECRIDTIDESRSPALSEEGRVTCQ